MATQLKDAEIEEPIEAEEVAEAPAERDWEAEAKEMGWRPLEDFPGDPARHVSAQAFVERGEQFMPLLKKQNAHLKRELDDIKRSLKRASEHFGKAEERAYERARADLEQRMDAAVEAGDQAGARKILKDMDALRPTDDDKPGHTVEEAQAAWIGWREEHLWYDRANLSGASDTDKEMRVYADLLIQKHLAKTEELAPADFFEFIGEEVSKKFPNPGKAAPRQTSRIAEVAGGSRRPAGQRGRSFDDLPADAQRMCDKWVSQKIIPNREAYLKSYQWDA